MRRVWWVGASLLAACGGEDTIAPPDEDPPVQCAEGEVALPDGSCIRPGVPPDACAEGFVHDGEYGCEPILPAQACAPGQIAIPGDTTCRPIMDCGTGRWGNLPVDGATVYVDQAYAAGDGDGSEAKPWPTIGEALTAAAPGALVAIAAGSYEEGVFINGKAVQLWGVCPDLVSIVGTGQSVGSCPSSSLCVIGSEGTVIGGLSLTGPGYGALIFSASNILLDRVRLHDNGQPGVLFASFMGPTTFELRDSLSESNVEAGVYAIGSMGSVERSLLRDNLPALNGRGIGLIAQLACSDGGNGTLSCDPEQRAAVNLHQSLIDNNEDIGVAAAGSDAHLDGVVVRGTRPRQSDQEGGSGVVIQRSCASLIDCEGVTRGNGSLLGSVVDSNHEDGVAIFGADMLIEGTVIRNTLPTAAEGRGIGLTVGVSCDDTPTGYICDNTVRADTAVNRSLIEESHVAGVLIGASDATFDHSVVRRTAPRQVDQRFGLGIDVSAPCHPLADGSSYCDPDGPSNATIRATLIDDSHDVGLYVLSSNAVVESSVIAQTAARPDGTFGDGLSLHNNLGQTTVSAHNLLVSDSARAGISVFGSALSMSSSRVRCAAINLHGSVNGPSDFNVDDLGDNLCGCPTATDTCKLLTSDIQPPEAP
jgi:hypothetical protein